MDLCLLSCYVHMHLVMMFYLLVLLSYDILASSSCWCWLCSSVHDYRLLPSTVDIHVSFASSWLHDYLVVLSLYSCMIFTSYASGYAMLMSSVMLVLFMLVGMPCSFGYMFHCGYAR